MKICAELKLITTCSFVTLGGDSSSIQENTIPIPSDMSHCTKQKRFSENQRYLTLKNWNWKTSLDETILKKKFLNYTFLKIGKFVTELN